MISSRAGMALVVILPEAGRWIWVLENVPTEKKRLKASSCRDICIQIKDLQYELLSRRGRAECRIFPLATLVPLF
jgi:hypothetical protein